MSEGLLKEHADYIESSDAKAAFAFLTAHAVKLANYECGPQHKGFIRDFRYYSNGRQPYAFIVNKESLLFYIRKPGLRMVPGGKAALAAQFTQVGENSKGEWTVRIQNEADAYRLVTVVFGSAT